MKALLQWFFFVEEQYYSSVDRISRNGKVGKYLPLINTSHDTISENFQNYSETETCNKKKNIYPLQHLRPLFPAFFLSHSQTCAYTLSRSSGAAVRWSASVLGSYCSPVRAETRPGLDRDCVAMRSQEHRPPVRGTWAGALINTVLTTTCSPATPYTIAHTRSPLSRLLA